MAGLWTEVDHPGPKTLWIVPPAWGRTKESTSLLAQTLAATADAACRHTAVLRLDYGDTLGQSFRTDAPPEAGREALDLTVTGCVADIRTAVDYAFGRLDQEVDRAVIVGMSFSGPLCLRVAATDRRVTHLVQLMGASDVQDLVRTATGGLDFVARHRAGLRSGLQNVLGLLSNTDRWCSDGLDAELLQLRHAQRDAGDLRAELLWVHGEHDAFVNQARVRRTLLASGAPRRVLAHVPCGHVPTQTREAVLSYAPVLAFVHDTPDGPPTHPQVVVLPHDDQIAAATTAEWAATRRERLASPRDYWRRYMEGESEDELGFDVLTLTREYGEMMALQAELLAAPAGTRVHDVGGGLGHSVPHLSRQAGGPLEVHLYDLVPEILATAARRSSGTDTRVRPHVWDATQEVPASLSGATHVLMSLFLSVLPDPADTLRRVAAVLPDGATLVASSIRPDADLSLVYQRLLADVARGAVKPPAGHDAESLCEAIRAYICSAAHLLRLAEEGTFRLYEPDELASLVAAAGFEVDDLVPCFGRPARAVVVRATRRRP